MSDGIGPLTKAQARTWNALLRLDAAGVSAELIGEVTLCASAMADAGRAEALATSLPVQTWLTRPTRKGFWWMRSANGCARPVEVSEVYRDSDDVRFSVYETGVEVSSWSSEPDIVAARWLELTPPADSVSPADPAPLFPLRSP